MVYLITKFISVHWYLKFIAPSPVSDVIYWYHCVGKGHLQWFMEDTHDILECMENLMYKKNEKPKEIIFKLKS